MLPIQFRWKLIYSKISMHWHLSRSQQRQKQQQPHGVAKIAALTVLEHAKLVARFYWFSVSRSICVQFKSIICKPLLSLVLLLLLHLFLNHTHNAMHCTALFSIPANSCPSLVLFHVVIYPLVIHFHAIWRVRFNKSVVVSHKKNGATTTIRSLWRFLGDWGDCTQ